MTGLEQRGWTIGFSFDMFSAATARRPSSICVHEPEIFFRQDAPMRAS